MTTQEPNPPSSREVEEVIWRFREWLEGASNPTDRPQYIQPSIEDFEIILAALDKLQHEEQKWRARNTAKWNGIAAATKPKLQNKRVAELEAERAVLRKALRPFAQMADQVDKWQNGTDPVFPGEFDANDLRHARAALTPEGKADHG